MPFPLVGLLGSLLPSLFGVISEVVEDKDKRNKLHADLEKLLREYETTALKGQIEIIVAEAKGDSWIQKSWRPILMLTIVGIVANNNLIAPWANAFGLNLPILPLDPELYTLMTVGVGGYIVGRTGEKAVKAWKQGN